MRGEVGRRSEDDIKIVWQANEDMNEDVKQENKRGTSREDSNDWKGRNVVVGV